MAIKVAMRNPFAVVNASIGDDPSRPATEPQGSGQKAGVLVQLTAPPALLLLGWSQLALSDQWKASISAAVGIVAAALAVFPAWRPRPTKFSLIGVSLGCLIMAVYGVVSMLSGIQIQPTASDNIDMKDGDRASFIIADTHGRKSLAISIDANNNIHSGNNCAAVTTLKLFLNAAGNRQPRAEVTRGQKAVISVSSVERAVTIEVVIAIAQKQTSCRVDLNVIDAELR